MPGCVGAAPEVWAPPKPDAPGSGADLSQTLQSLHSDVESSTSADVSSDETSSFLASVHPKPGEDSIDWFTTLLHHLELNELEKELRILVPAGVGLLCVSLLLCGHSSLPLLLERAHKNTQVRTSVHGNPTPTNLHTHTHTQTHKHALVCMLARTCTHTRTQKKKIMYTNIYTVDMYCKHTHNLDNNHHMRSGTDFFSHGAFSFKRRRESQWIHLSMVAERGSVDSCRKQEVEGESIEKYGEEGATVKEFERDPETPRAWKAMTEDQMAESFLSQRKQVETQGER